MKQEIYSLVHLKQLKENTMFMKKLLCQRISKEAIRLMILAIGFCFMCCKSDNRNIDCILQYVYSNYYENRETQDSVGYYPRIYILLFRCVNLMNEDLRFPLYLSQDKRSEPAFRFYYKGKELKTMQSFHFKNHYKWYDFDYVKNGIFPAKDTLFFEVELYEKSLAEVGISRETDIRCMFDSIDAYYLRNINNSNSYKIKKEGDVRFNRNFKPIVISIDTERLPWEKEKYLRLKKDENVYI